MTVVEILRKIRQGNSFLLGGDAGDQDGNEHEAEATTPEPAASDTLLRTLGWVSAGAGALGLGLVVGRELRQRYKFSRRTPYDAYAHAGDYKGDLEFGVGI